MYQLLDLGLHSPFEVFDRYRAVLKMSTSHHALIFGASGISGWALVKEELSYPTPTTFSKVSALSKRLLSLAEAQWPDDPRLQLASGIDLTCPVDTVVRALKRKVGEVENVSHVFVFLYLDPGKDHKTLGEVNTNLIKTAAETTQKVSSKIVSFILQTGGKAYGLGLFAVLFSYDLLNVSVRAPRCC